MSLRETQQNWGRFLKNEVHNLNEFNQVRHTFKTIDPLKTSNFELQRKIYGIKLFEFHEQLINDAFLIKVTQFEKTRSIGKILASLRNLKIKFHFLN